MDNADRVAIMRALTWIVMFAAVCLEALLALVGLHDWALRVDAWIGQHDREGESD